MSLFNDIFTNPEKCRQIGFRKYTVIVNGQLYGIVLATKTPGYDSFALNKGEFDDLLKGKRDGKLAGAFVVGATTYNGGKYDPVYVGEIDAEVLEKRLPEPRYGRFGEFYALWDYIFTGADAAF
jgi:hypothetical protein